MKTCGGCQYRNEHGVCVALTPMLGWRGLLVSGGMDTSVDNESEFAATCDAYEAMEEK
jgi:hypothetical protein